MISGSAFRNASSLLCLSCTVSPQSRAKAALSELQAEVTTAGVADRPAVEVATLTGHLRRGDERWIDERRQRARLVVAHLPETSRELVAAAQPLSAEARAIVHGVRRFANSRAPVRPLAAWSH